MKIEDLPAEIFIPSIKIQDEGFLDIQCKDKDGKMAVFVWGTLEQAKEWLAKGGKDLWEEKRGRTLDTKNGIFRVIAGESLIPIGPKGFWKEKGEALDDSENEIFLVIRTEETIRHLQLILFMGGSIHYEPDIGQLFSPPERIIA